MNLLTFAHRKEAEAFILNLQFKNLPFHFDGLFKNNTDYLLITGEGVQNSTERLTSVLSVFGTDIITIINLGVAGSVDSKITKNSIHLIRTSYAHHAERLEFKSFTTSNKDATQDCLTIFERINKREDRIRLSPLASIIDRELWANGSVAHLFKKLFFSIKYISDDLESEDFCMSVINESSNISNKLFDYYTQVSNIPNAVHDTVSLDLFTRSKLFHFTVTQIRQLENFFEILAIKKISPDSVFKDFYNQELMLANILPKERSKKLLNHLLCLVNPMHSRINANFDLLLKEIRQNRIEVNIDPKLEDQSIYLNFSVKNKTEMDKRIQALKNLDIEKIENIFNGFFDV